MQLYVGKYYKTRDGNKAFVSGEWGKSPDGSDSHYPVLGWVLYDDACWLAKSWTSTGMMLNDDSECSDDLIAEWVEPVTRTVDVVLLRWKDGSIGYYTANSGHESYGLGKVIARRTITLAEGEGV